MLPKEDRELPESQTCPRSNCCGATGCTAPFLSTCRGRNTRRITLTFHFLSTHDRTVTKAVGRMQQTNRQSSEPTENIVSVDTASHLNAAHAIRMSQKTARSEARSDMTIQQPAHMPSENTTALRKYHRNGGPKQRLGGPSLKEREGKGSEWRSASGRRQLQTRTQDHGFLPKPPHTTHDVDRPPTGAVGAWNAPSVPRAC